MKAFVAILLTANIAMGAWLYLDHEPPPERDMPPLPAPPLVLAGELPASPPPAQATDLPGQPVESDTDPEIEPSALTCQALGPFMDRDDALRASRALVESGVNPEMREVETSHRLGFWVFIQPAPDRATAGAQIDRLRGAGIRDYYLVADGEHANAVSLGVFSTSEAANQHASRLRGLGFDVEIGDRRRTVSAWWLDFVAPGTGTRPAEVVARLVLEAEAALMLDTQPCR